MMKIESADMGDKTDFLRLGRIHGTVSDQHLCLMHVFSNKYDGVLFEGHQIYQAQRTMQSHNQCSCTVKEPIFPYGITYNCAYF